MLTDTRNSFRRIGDDDWMVQFTEEEKELLISLLVSTNFAKELVANEINDMEMGEKKLESSTYKKLIQIYDKVI
ncbi:hypothetical protein JOC95_003693 [Bacillus tianshenii]|uniref:Uncharacterized protein n=2 Tax=Sutcliffiella tianshenii TaxID=1463404 RepID=A0ABS2P5V1_9BACI|nr:hypothetical protein [Bacillus tianshenii]